MNVPATIRDLFDILKNKLALEWVAGEAGGCRRLKGGLPEAQSQPLAGQLNNIHPNRIQVIGPAELAYLEDLGKNSHQDVMDKLFWGLPAAVILANNAEVDQEFIDYAERTNTPLLRSSLPDNKLLSNLQYYLTRALADSITLHGVFLEVLGMGVLLTGDPAVGKSELALELITRGHRLIADDAPEFSLMAPDILTGSCPPLLQEFLEVRGLGILNIRSMFGDSCIKKEKYLRLIINLKQLGDEELARMDRLQGSYSTRELLGVETPEVTLPVAPGRNLAILVETAVRQHIHRRSGYDAGADFIERQRKMIFENEAKNKNKPTSLS